MPTDWDSRIADHHAAVEEYCATARRLDEAAWHRAVTEGKWSPGEITEHLAMSYAILRSELRGAGGMRPRTNWWQRTLLRVAILPVILVKGRIPRRVMAPREIRPAGGTFEREPTLARMVGEADALMRELGERRDVKLTHPFFGKLTAPEVVRFLAVHTRHHLGQLPT